MKSHLKQDYIMGRSQKMKYWMTETRLGSVEKITLIILMVLNIALIAFDLAVVLRIQTFWKQWEEDGAHEEKNTMKEHYRRYCFRSGERECSDRGYYLKQKNDQTVCCGNSNEHLYSVMSEAVSGRLQSDSRKEQSLDEVRKYITQLQHDPTAVKIRPWPMWEFCRMGTSPDQIQTIFAFTGKDMANCHLCPGGVIHGGDRLIVNKAGLYYVYTGLQFTVDPMTSSTLTLVAFLFRHVNGTRESQKKLMMSRASSCKRTRDSDVTAPVSLYMAGIYLLRPGEEISVMTGHHTLLHRSAATSYLGLHMI